MKRILVILSLFLLAFTPPEHITPMWNCGEPAGIMVIETGRVIRLNERFDMLGSEWISDDGILFARVYDGTIISEFTCNVEP